MKVPEPFSKITCTLLDPYFAFSILLFASFRDFGPQRVHMFIASIFCIGIALINHVFNLFRTFVTSLDSTIYYCSNSRLLLKKSLASWPLLRLIRVRINVLHFVDAKIFSLDVMFSLPHLQMFRFLGCFLFHFLATILRFGRIFSSILGRISMHQSSHTPLFHRHIFCISRSIISISSGFGNYHFEHVSLR